MKTEYKEEYYFGEDMGVDDTLDNIKDYIIWLKNQLSQRDKRIKQLEEKYTDVLNKYTDHIDNS